MTQLTVVAKIQAKSGSEAVLYQELLQLIQPTLLEEGCLNYDLHRSIEDKTLFLFYENWASRVFWEKQIVSEHIGVFQKNTEGLIENWELLLMKPEKSRS
ncbi:antibiotic biosynthesis monooxygenase [Pleurocapsales cyanobacterium LEGE 06147]|nr:antibiotic biosynthesis monooxygenase [Pleurocapsales cyanobacterium LEGE 06147]